MEGIVRPRRPDGKTPAPLPHDPGRARGVAAPVVRSARRDTGRPRTAAPRSPVADGAQRTRGHSEGSGSSG
ncbi:hypothetical protein Q7689_36635, partial [Nocardiopsis tropica]|nr:hypothetical protein [Nocardiopsis tropica]